MPHQTIKQPKAMTTIVKTQPIVKEPSLKGNNINNPYIVPGQRKNVVKPNTYVHSKSVIKGKCREAIKDNLKERFANVKTLNTVTLGGEDLETEHLLKNDFNLNGLSYEFNPKSVANAKRNAPQGVKVVEGNIFNHNYKGNEHFIWFDFMTCLRIENVSQLCKWVCNNPITNDCVFAVTYTLHCRNIKGEGYRQLFENEAEHDNFIDDMKNYIGMYLENEFVSVAPNVSVIRYCNTDISKKSLPMVQFIFNLHKK